MESGEQVPNNLYHFFIYVIFDSHKDIVVMTPLFQRRELELRNGKKLAQGLKDRSKNLDLSPISTIPNWNKTSGHKLNMRPACSKILLLGAPMWLSRLKA